MLGGLVPSLTGGHLVVGVGWFYSHRWVFGDLIPSLISHRWVFIPSLIYRWVLGDLIPSLVGGYLVVSFPVS